MTQLDSSKIIGALNDFKNLMKVCFSDNNIKDITPFNIKDDITTITVTEPETLLTKDIGSTFGTINHLNDFLAKIKINGILLNTQLTEPSEFSIASIKETINNEITIITIIPEYKDYLATLIYYYYYLIILCVIGCINGIANDTALYKSYKLHMTEYIKEIKNINITIPINNYAINKAKVIETSDAFIEQKTDNKKILTEIETYDGFLSYVYLYIYFIILLLIVSIIFCIFFKNRNSYLISILVLLIIINALFSKYVIVIEGFTTNYDVDANIDVRSNFNCGERHLPAEPNNLNQIKHHLCQVLNVTYERFKKNDLPIINKVSINLITENNLYKKLYAKMKSLNINKKDTINLNLLSFYQRKEYVNLFTRIIILAILILILYNIFGFHYIIVILGIILFSLIVMIYLYSMKKISRTDYKNINWNHKFKFN